MTYGLASTQKSFVAAMNGIGACTNFVSKDPTNCQSLLSSIPFGNLSALDFVGT